MGIAREYFCNLNICVLFLIIKFREKNEAKVKFNQNCSEMFENVLFLYCLANKLSSIRNMDFGGDDTANSNYYRRYVFFVNAID